MWGTLQITSQGADQASECLVDLGLFSGQKAKIWAFLALKYIFYEGLKNFLKKSISWTHK